MNRDQYSAKRTMLYGADEARLARGAATLAWLLEITRLREVFDLFEQDLLTLWLLDDL